MENQKNNIVIVGASGGIGSGFVERYLDDKNTNHVYALSRSVTEYSDERVTNLTCDILNDTSISDTVAHISDHIQRVIVATGLLHEGDNIVPEKSMNDINFDNFETIFAVNTHAVALLMKYFLPKLDKKRPSVFATLSARIGSISDNRIGGWYAYRASKAALNMLVKTASIELSRKNKTASIIALHPGTVDTSLSKPFQSYVKDEHLFTKEHATQMMKDVIESREADQHTGKIYAYDGTEIHP